MSREQSSRDILYGSSGPEVLISVICIHFAAEPATIQDSPDHLGLLVIRNGVVRLQPLNDLGNRKPIVQGKESRAGKVDEAQAIKNTDIAEELELPPVKIHCSILAEDAIKAAIADYKSKREAK